MYPVTFLTRRDIEDAAHSLGVDPAVVHAVTQVEARGSGFIRGTDLPVILFEGHIFSRETGHRHDKAHPHISYRKWTKAHYSGGRGEYDRLFEAAQLDQRAALKAASYGLFQIMGFNHQAAGYPSVEDYVNDMATGEPAHLRAFVGFLNSHPGMVQDLRNKEWADFAHAYNGPGYKRNKYHTKLAAAFAKALLAAKHDDLPMERGDMAALQTALNAFLNMPGLSLAVDGWYGPKTAMAIRKFQELNGLPITGEPDEATRAALGVD